jgi:hypothetical protein
MEVAPAGSGAPALPSIRLQDYSAGAGGIYLALDMLAYQGIPDGIIGVEDAILHPPLPVLIELKGYSSKT